MGLSFGDVDQDQFFELKLEGGASYNKMYALRNSTVQYWDNAGSGNTRVFYDNGFTTSNDGLESMVRAEINNASVFSITYGYKYDLGGNVTDYPFHNEDDYSEEQFLTKLLNRHKAEDVLRALPDGGSGPYADTFGWGYFDATGFGPYSQPAPTKRVDKTSAKKGDKITYRVSQDIPQQSSKYYYNEFKFEDTLPECLDIIQNEIDILDMDGDSVKNNFNISVTSKKITITAKSSYLSNENFYGNTYTFVIPANINDNLESFKKGNIYEFKNKGSVTVNGNNVDSSTKETNEVTTQVEENKYKIETSIDHGTITPDMNDIPEGEDRSVTFTPAPGWHVSKVEVDGKEAEFVTDADGKIYIPDMPTGIYYLKETKAPYGYDLSDEVLKAEITDGKLTILTAKEPYKKAKLLEKEDSFTKDVIEGVKFEILDEDKSVIYTGITNKTGILEVPILLFENGKKYYYREIEAPDMYNLTKDKKEELYEFEVKIDEENCTWLLDKIVVDNDRKTKKKVTIQKLDEDTHEPLPNCEFYIVLIDENGNEYVNRYGEKVYLVENGVTDENGMFEIDNVPEGKYKFVETTVPEGYRLPNDDQTFIFTIDENSPDEQHFIVLDGKMINVDTSDINVASLVVITFMSAIGVIYIVNRKKVKRT